MLDVRQSKEYALFMQSIGWRVQKVGECHAFIKKFPLVGSFIKIQRPEIIPSISEIESLRRKERAFKIVIEPCFDAGTTDLINHGFKPTSPYAPSKTIQIDLTPSLEEIFNSFPKTTRWAIRKAEKNGIVIKEGSVNEFVKLKTKGFLFLQNSFSNQIRELYKAFSPHEKYSSSEGALATESRSSTHYGSRLATLARTINDSRAITLIAYKDSQMLGGIFLLFRDSVAYYWMASATNEGKRLAAPSLLVWEALKLAKEKECTIFDFEGVFDERFPKQTSSWKGFTKFKEGFGGKEVYFPKPIGKNFIPIFH